MGRSAAPAVLLLLCCPATRGETALTYTAHPNMDCNQDDAECEPFHSCRDANGTCIPCCDPATDGEAGCLRKLEAACNSNAVPFGKSAAFECVGFGYAPPGTHAGGVASARKPNPGFLRERALPKARPERGAFFNLAAPPGREGLRSPSRKRRPGGPPR